MTQSAGRGCLAISALPLAFALACRPVMAESQTDTAAQESDVLQMSLEDLLSVQVTSVSKKPQSLSDAPAAVFVISNEDLHRSGATNIPDALRMVPGVHVARIDSNKWAVTVRGFNGRFANKLLVLMDGRAVYSPSFSGVYWESQDLMLEDVERIEVVRGPGGTIWGANAVNGVINIITKHAADTQGGLVSAGGGSEERGFASARYGARLGQGTYGRVYVRALERDELVHADGTDAGDDWSAIRGGFRLDSRLDAQDNLTLQGDIYRGDINQEVILANLSPPFSRLVEDSASMSGGNAIARWDRTSSTSSWSLQANFDRYERNEAIVGILRDTFDLDLTHRLTFGTRQEIVWGLGYRYTADDFTSTPSIDVVPDSRDDHLFSAFLQDEIELVDDRLWLTLGSKLEHNDYTGFELQPSVRLAWTLDTRNKLWAAVSRTVRTPSRVDDSFNVAVVTREPFGEYNPTAYPVLVVGTGNPVMDSEEVVAYEIGYRTAPSRHLSLDLAGFYNRYDSLRTFVAETPIFTGDYYILPLRFDNGVSGETYGVELAATWQAMEKTRLDLAYSFIATDVHWLDPFDPAQNTEAPRHQLSLRSTTDLRDDLHLDLWLRYVDDFKAVNTSLDVSEVQVDGYLTLDIRLAWRAAPGLELSLVGQNLLDGQHLEYVQELFTLPTEVQPSVYAKLEWRF